MMNLLSKLDDSTNFQLSTLDLVIIPALFDLDIIEQSAFSMQALQKIKHLTDFKKAFWLLEKSLPNANLNLHSSGLVRIFNAATLHHELKFQVRLTDSLGCFHAYLFNDDATRFRK